MTKLLFRTKGNSAPGNKPKVYFSCHPDDFEKTFDAVCEDIFQTHDCTIFYKEDMADELPEDTRETDLGSMNLFVFPVTFKLLQDPTTARDTDLAFAKRERRPILPIMFEANGGQSILPIYSRPELFGERQFLAKFSSDLTEISYADKLKKYLDATLIDDQTAEKIRKAFDAYIFLSYRKKDRKYANELMHLIHSDPVCRDIAIWFDEFLMPGESFELSIEKALQKSKLFTLLVTPSLLETDAEGNKNYVQREEYPRAKASGMPILPAEKVPTDREALAGDYADLPEVVDANDAEGFRQAFLEAVRDIAKRGNDDDPMHNYLIGLAYLNGIDVEINVDYGVKLVTKAAEAELPVAMVKLYDMYENGSYVTVDYGMACEWAEKTCELFKTTCGEESPVTLAWLNRFAVSLIHNGEYKRAAELAEQCYETQCRTQGREHLGTLADLNTLSVCYSKLGDHKRAAELIEQNQDVIQGIDAKHDPDIITALTNLAFFYSELGNNEKAVELTKQGYDAQCELLGAEHKDTLISLNNLSHFYYLQNNGIKAVRLGEKSYKGLCKVLGKEHPDTLTSLSNLILCYSMIGNYKKAAALSEQCYKARCRVLGKEHPDTLCALGELAIRASELGDKKKALKLAEQCYAARCKVLGKEHKETLGTMNDLAGYNYDLGDLSEAIRIAEECYQLRCEVLGTDHPDALHTLSDLALFYFKLGDLKKAAELGEKCVEAESRVLGKEHIITIISLGNLADCYYEQGDYRKEANARKALYDAFYITQGKCAKKTLDALVNLAYTYSLAGNMYTALALHRKLYDALYILLCTTHQVELIAYKEQIDNTHITDDMDYLCTIGHELIRLLP